jgi:polyisoprenoid-binding protein YceI
MISNVSGTFNNFNTEVETDGPDFQLKAEIGSINTNNAQRDGHLRSSTEMIGALASMLCWKQVI